VFTSGFNFLGLVPLLKEHTPSSKVRSADDHMAVLTTSSHALTSSRPFTQMADDADQFVGLWQRHDTKMRNELSTTIQRFNKNTNISILRISLCVVIVLRISLCVYYIFHCFTSLHYVLQIVYRNIDNL